MNSSAHPDRVPSALRSAITSASDLAEAECLAALLDLADSPAEATKRMADQALRLVRQIRSKPRSTAERLMFEYSLSSEEGLALMRLAEAFLRIPDTATRDTLIRDKIVGRNWLAHLRRGQSPAVNAVTLGLHLAAIVLADVDGQNAARRLFARTSLPFARAAVALAMRRLGKHFVAGETIGSALRNNRRDEARGFRHSYDMLGEAALTEADAARYMAAYEAAIHSVGRHSEGRGIFDGPGISVKLSALHPTYARNKINRVHDELLPRLRHLAALARRYDIGFNIDAEEADRLELSLDLIEALCFDPDLAGWDGIGFAVQAYQKRAPQVIDWAVDLGRRSGRRLMMRLVKGAYWDMEIKRAQVEGLAQFPVFTRKVHTDVCYLACARKMLAAPDSVFPQFATHNAQTIAALMEMAGDIHPRRFEFQCLHGMGQAVFEDLVGEGRRRVPCRMYAPVGSFDTLLPYLVRRLIENGANSSFVHRIGDESLDDESLVAHPVDLARAVNPVGAPHERIALPADIYGPARRNSRGYDLSNEDDLAELENGIRESAGIAWKAAPTHSAGPRSERPIVNPADHTDIVGHVREASIEDVQIALSIAEDAARRWVEMTAGMRAACLARAADLFQARMPVLVGLIVREAGKTIENAIGEVREAIDFLRYYGREAVRTLDDDPDGALGTVVCISPWNFPLAIFIGQVAAALAAGNAVIAKPAEETPLIAAEAVRILLEAGVSSGAVQLLPGDGDVGAALIADTRTQGVLFTGSTAVARLIQKQSANRLSLDGGPVPLVAETGGQNTIIVDSSALPEQTVIDIMKSAFDSAGQRCSAARILCVQEEVAPAILHMLRGAMTELSTGDPRELSTDVGPIISAEARENIEKHIDAMRIRGCTVFSAPPADLTHRGHYIAPTLIEIERIGDLTHEVFGPVLHVVRYRRETLSEIIGAINATGYGLTFGVQSRVDRTVAEAASASSAGNIYVNRNIIGAVVGVQPFGGSGLSGTGPKAGGPLYLGRLRRRPPVPAIEAASHRALQSGEINAYSSWLRSIGRGAEAEECDRHAAQTSSDFPIDLPGPVGEINRYSLEPRGRIAALASTESDALIQFGVILATRNTMVIEETNPALEILSRLPIALYGNIQIVRDWRTIDDLGAILFAGSPASLLDVQRTAANRNGPILQIQSSFRECQNTARYKLDRLFEERLVCTNSAAAGGNASLLSVL